MKHVRRPQTCWRAALGMTLAAAATWPAASLANPGAHGPNGEHLDTPGASTQASGLGRLADGSVNLPKNAQRRLEIRTVLAPQTEAAASVELTGRVVLDPNASGRVQTTRGGRVEPGSAGLPVAGQTVRRGQVLARVRITSDPYAAGSQQSQLSELRTQRLLAEHRWQRLQGLEGTVPRKEIEAARLEASGLAERERSIGASLNAMETLVAPTSGVIARADVVAGQVVEPRDVLFEIIDPSRLLVEATTADVALANRLAGAALQGMPDATLRLVGAARVLREGVLPLTFAVTSTKPGTPLALAVGQPVSVIVQSSEKASGIVLPSEAIVRNAANETVVWVKAGTERFVPQPVQVRPLAAGTVLVTRGLSADNRVVVRGAGLIAQIR